MPRTLSRSTTASRDAGVGIPVDDSCCGGHCSGASKIQASRGLLGCRVEDDWPIWFNQVGRFGAACAAYHFARLASLLGRLVMRLGGQSHTFQLLFADDLKMVAAGKDKYDHIWYMLMAWLMLGTPFRWPKFRGGVCLEFVGFYMDYCKFEVGLSERRTNWIVQWVELRRLVRTEAWSPTGVLWSLWGVWCTLDRCWFG